MNVAKLQISGVWTKFPVDFSPESMILEELLEKLGGTYPHNYRLCVYADSIIPSLHFS